MSFGTFLKELEKSMSFDEVNHPAHYGGDTTYEAIKVIEAWQLGFHLGNAVKYICRQDKKGSSLENLRKAKWYIERQIAIEEKELAQRIEEEKAQCSFFPDDSRIKEALAQQSQPTESIDLDWLDVEELEVYQG